MTKEQSLLNHEWDALLSVYADLNTYGRMYAKKRIREIEEKLSTHQADPADPQKCPECGGPMLNGIETHSPFCIKNILGE